MSQPNRKQLLEANQKALEAAGLTPVSSGTHLERVRELAKSQGDRQVARLADDLIDRRLTDDPTVYDTDAVTEIPPLEQQEMAERIKNAARLEEVKTAYDD